MINTYITNNKLNIVKHAGDAFDNNSIVLIQISNVPENFETEELITSIDCTLSENYVIKQSDLTFESIYNVGKDVFSHSYNSNKTLLNLTLTKEIKEFCIKIFNDYVIDNGYPYLIEQLPHVADHIQIPNFEVFIFDSLNIYLIDEMRKSIIKIRKEEEASNADYVTSSFTGLKKKYDYFKDELISAVFNETITVVYDDISKEQVLEVLQKGLPKDIKKNAYPRQELLKFLNILQRTLIVYVISIINNGYKEQYKISKQLPIYNSTSDQYRLYTTANSSVGIAYNYLLNNLTASKTNFLRLVCAYPECNNEFEKDGKNLYCEFHRYDDDLKRKHIKHMSYLRCKKKKEATKK